MTQRMFYNGFVVTKFDIGEYCAPTGMILVKVLEDLNAIPVEMSVGSDIVVQASKLERLCDDVFEIGDSIRSTLRTDYPLEGIVVGFEQDTNRVIVRSTKIENYQDRRTRYAYKLYEIESYRPGLFKWRANKCYVVNGTTTVTVKYIADNKAMLYDTSDNFFASVPVEAILTSYAIHHKIYQIQEM